MIAMEKTILTYGTFDLFHIGHLKLLERAASLGNKLIVGVSTDEFNSEKGKKSVFPYHHRASIVGSLKFVDGIIPENSWDQKAEDIKNNNITCLVMGDDWREKFDYLGAYCEVRYLPRTTGISTTEIKNLLHNVNSAKIMEIKDALSALEFVVNSLGE